MKTKENPGLGAGAKGTLRKVSADPTGDTAAPSLQRFPRLLSERFPGKVRAIKHARDRVSLLRAVADFVHAGMFIRHMGRTYSPLTRFAIAHEALTYARLSVARGEVPAIEIAAITARMDIQVREKWVA